MRTIEITTKAKRIYFEIEGEKPESQKVTGAAQKVGYRRDVFCVKSGFAETSRKNYHVKQMVLLATELKKPKK